MLSNIRNQFQSLFEKSTYGPPQELMIQKVGPRVFIRRISHRQFRIPDI